MKISETSVKNPITTLMIFLGILVLGVVSYSFLSVDMMPEIETPTVSVMTRWDGASTVDVEQQVTRVIESALGSVTDLDEITSRTAEGSSRVTCKFKWGTDLGEASNDMRDLLERAKRRLPDDADDPVMMKFNSANMPVLVFNVTAKENREKMQTIVDDYLIDPIKRIPGVGTAEYFGGLQRQINVHLDPDRLSAYGLSVIDIADAIHAENQQQPAGNIKIGTIDYTIRVPGEFTDSAQVGSVIVKKVGDKLVRVADVSRVEDGFVEENNVVEDNGRPGLMVMVQKRSGENTMDVCTRVKARVAELESQLPADFRVSVVSDASDMIGKSIRNVGKTVLYGGLFVILTTLFFLRSVRISLVIALTIPFSLIIAFIFMYFMDWTLNLMSLSALAIAIGMVVDNAVVVLENIVSHMARGERRREASMFGSDEVGTAILASTLTTIVVFLPLVFVKGISGIMMQQLGGLITATLCASVLCSLMLTPMLASRIVRLPDLSGKTRLSRFHLRGERTFDRLDTAYGRFLDKALSARWLVVLVALAVVGLSAFGFTRLGSEFMGKEDTGELTIVYNLPLSTRYEITTETGRRILEVVKRVAGEDKIERFTLSAGGSSGGFGGTRASHIGRVRLKFVPSDQRDWTSDEIGDLVTREVREWPEVTKVHANSNNFMNRILRGGGANLSIEIYGYDLDRTYPIAQQIKKIVDATPGSRDSRVAQDMGMPELRIEVDRAKASALGISMSELTTVVSTLFQGNDCSQYREGEDEYDITLRLDRSQRNTIEDIRRSELPLADGRRIRLDTVAEVVEGSGPLTIERKNQQRIVTVDFDAVDGMPEGTLMEQVRERIQKEVLLPEGVMIEYGGMIEDQKESEKTMTMMIVLGVLLVYMVMASQFESLLHPLLIMFSVPFAFSGVVAVLLLTGTPLSMTAYIGMILLVGIVVNNAIVLIDYINLLRARGIPLRQAICESGRRRLRPVLITTCTTLLGMLPMALSHGDGSATWRPLGLVVVGGLAVSTLISMVLVPVLYYLCEKHRKGAAGQ